MKKANDFICIWQGATVDQSEFQAFEDLEKWGWKEQEPPFEYEDEPNCESSPVQ